ncbi:SH3 domain-binding protein 4-A [Parambassis ranga]|uniref:SH3 domain-binding protein 4-A-like n=1 Tax=Parambassis ranga TaxID=210632 RepID=A0A6P7HXC7_9TELE|nr:SH3 domain-binding protein 4-A-like [Parambassis ranga]XP_028255189.1 SH3 domain-binding protein 4-A-like [Parambassis ranga]XP_028255190.1 SH3 domain-binding protein 4-A-like [Parambassis ranga]XP_028255192.1 SH3 domain-binding protein 4-A-like [Parambassis ranga]XP_028255193.1 SH3 domain-binding protein 4-A-like [Parambassis ranga]
MAAHRIIRVTSSSNHVLPRCKSEGTLIDLGDGVTAAGLNDVKVPSPSALRLDTSASYGAAQEVVAIKDYCPSSFTTLRFSKGDRLYVLDTSGGEWWYAHNNTEMGYIPAAYVQPLNFRNSSLSDSGMIDSIGEGCEDGGFGEWTGTSLKVSHSYSMNPFICSPDQNCKNSADLIVFDALASPSSCSNFSAIMNSSCHINTPTSLNQEATSGLHRDNPFFRSKRSHSLSELSILQAQSNPTLPSSGFFTGLKAPSPEQFQSREDFRTAWLNHRKLARSCHDLDSLGQSPGWGQTQPVETNIVCRLDYNGGVVQLPETQISVHIPEGHVSHGDHQQISMKALLDPPLELNSDRCSTVSPVVEIKLSNMETKSFITLEMKVSVSVRKESCHAAEVLCVRSDCKEGPYTPIPNAYIYKDTVQVQLDSLEPCMYVAVVVQSLYVTHSTTVWDHVQRRVTLGVYGPKHIHPSFKTVVAMFGHDCAPKTLLVNEVGRQAGTTPPVALQLWGKHQFVLGHPQDLQVGLYSNMSNYQVKVCEGAGVVRGFQVKLGKVSRLLYMIASHNPSTISDFTLRVQVKDALDCILTQFCVQTPQPPPKTGARITGQRRFLKKKEVDKIILSPLAVTSKYPKFQDRIITSLKFGKLIKTVLRQHKSTYLLEYKKGDIIALLSEEKIKLRGQLRTKEWYIGYYQGKMGLVHAKNVLVLGKVKPIYWCGPDLTTTALLEQILRPCKFLTYIYATVRTVLMENVGSWRAFADALGYGNLPLNYFCRTELDNEAEKVASVLEKLKEECTNMESKERRSFQRELMMALLKMDCQGLVARLVLDFVLLTTAVEVASRWRELAEKLARVSRQQMEAYEAPHRDRNGLLDHEAMWKPAYDFLLTWAAHIGDSYRDIIQELHVGLDKMRNPITKRWKHLTGTLILVNCLDTLRGAAFCPTGYGDFAV